MFDSLFVSVADGIGQKTLNGANVSLSPMGKQDMFALGCWPSNRRQLHETISRMAGCAPEDLKTASVNVVSTPHCLIYRAGPDRYWIVLSGGSGQPEPKSKYKDSFFDSQVMTAEISCAYQWWRLKGKNAREILRRATRIDVSDDVFVPGEAALTRVWSIQALIHREASVSGNSYRIALPSTYVECGLSLFQRVFNLL